MLLDATARGHARGYGLGGEMGLDREPRDARDVSADDASLLPRRPDVATTELERLRRRVSLDVVAVGQFGGA